MANIKEIIHIVNLTGRFTMVTGLHGISIKVDGDTLLLHPFVQDPSWDGWRNFESPDIRITSSGEIFSILRHPSEWWDRLTENSHPQYFISINKYDWGINYFEEDANAVKAYILDLATMWAAYNKEVYHNA